MSGLPFELLLALRYLRPKRTFVSVITLISVLGVTLGVAVLIIVISVMSGFDRQLRDKILGFNPHLRITQPNQTITNYQALLHIIAENHNVQAAAPYVQAQVLVETEPQSGQSKASGPYLRGIDPQLQGRLNVLSSNIVSGEFDVSNRGMVVGSDFARGMELEVGDRVMVYSPAMLKRMRENQGKKGERVEVAPEFTIRGIFDVGYFEFDSAFIITSLEEAQDLYVLDDSVHGIEVKLKDPNRAAETAKELSAALDHRYLITTWMKENEMMLSALIVEKNVMFYLLFFIMIVAALCILSALITFVVQKTREIGMLKALGATDLQVSGLFLSQSGFVGVVGVLAGLGLGMLALAYRNEFLHFMRQATGWQLFPAEIYGFSELPSLIVPQDIAIICTSALIICLLGGLIPAWRAGRLKPVEALRYE